MADALVERRPTVRFFCHRCNIEFEDVLQDYTCPYCASGFIEQLEETEAGAGSGDEFSDADMSNLDDMTTIDEMSNLDDSDGLPQSTPPMLNDLAFLMSGGRLRGTGRRETLMEQLVWMIGGGRGGNVTNGTPFVLVGAPGDYVFGGEGLDAVVTQLLGQLENAGPPPLPREQINAIPSTLVTEAQAANNLTCSVCWEPFQLDETVSRLECEHIFHQACIGPWLQLHATCPICRRSLLPEGAPPAPLLAAAPAPPLDASSSQDGDNDSTSNTNTRSSTTWQPRVVLRRIGRRAGLGAGVSSSSNSSMSTSGTEWADTSSATRSSPSSSSVSVSPGPGANHTPRMPSSAYNMDIDFD